MGLLPIQLKASLNFLNNFSNCNFLGRKIVLIELKGGNDGLNTIIPINVYDEYIDLRPTTHIPISSLNFLSSIDPSILGTNQDIAFHPGLSGMFNLFSEGQLRISNLLDILTIIKAILHQLIFIIPVMMVIIGIMVNLVVGLADF